MPSTSEEVSWVLDLCRKQNTPYFILGNGSNVLFKDDGYRGVIISMKQPTKLNLINQTQITAAAGVMLKDLSAFAAQNSLTDLEFSCGIPGTVGGAVCMNAGAYDSEIKNVFLKGEFLNQNGEYCIKHADEMNFGYRTSAVQTENLVVLSATYQLTPASQSAVNGKITELTQKREAKQPLSDASAGSTFKRPEGHFAAKLIEDSGLKGFTIGGAAVSKTHSGFIINTGNATSADILNLIRHVKQTVHNKFGVMLETEVKIIGGD
jgi:UDP-N-acetylmuramate dehydrogenase